MQLIVGKGKVVTIIEKITAPEKDEYHKHPYYIARIQYSLPKKDDGLEHNIHAIGS